MEVITLREVQYKVHCAHTFTGDPAIHPLRPGTYTVRACLQECSEDHDCGAAITSSKVKNTGFEFGLNGFGRSHAEAKNIPVKADEESPLSATTLPNPSQIAPVTSNETSTPDEPHAIDPSHLAPPEKRLYDFLRSQGWTDAQCACYFTNIEPMKEALSQYFYWQGWTDDQMQAFHERCRMELPESLPAPRGDGDAAQQDLQMQLRLLEEANRRRVIGERMYPSTGPMGLWIAEERRI
ncbi:hypothetical protein CNMCM5793_000202 [Aspergillus hiratsukae]|uniref:Uncharacterized protein n=1 Tax=Aspergillus hiratsukae TaxID=1194566 RepID=A0A8H6UF14_9EURO|nr:hypothetical protein CNMCM5793_000202 [Aspergillus hiratsukae]KAF7164044.1 hypothetical protein CNMCM6106_000738 [Aspergillus hiratsukae]